MTIEELRKLKQSKALVYRKQRKRVYSNSGDSYIGVIVVDWHECGRYVKVFEGNGSRGSYWMDVCDLVLNRPLTPEEVERNNRIATALKAMVAIEGGWIRAGTALGDAAGCKNATGAWLNHLLKLGYLELRLVEVMGKRGPKLAKKREYKVSAAGRKFAGLSDDVAQPTAQPPAP